jgi:hypothetical protein
MKEKSFPEPGGEFKIHRWAKGILNCSNKGPIPLQRGDNRKNEVGSFRILVSRTTEPE